MRRFATVAWVLVVLSLGAAGAFYWRSLKTESAYAQMKQDEESTRIRYGQAIDEIAAIQDSLNTIVLGEKEARLIPSGLQSEMQLSETRGDLALARIGVIKAGIQRTKDRIEELDATLKRNGVKMAGLEKMIARLRRNVAEKEEMIAHLNVQVDSLQTTVTGLAADVEEKQRELGTIYFAMGTKKDLKERGVVVAKGGVLGLGKTLEPAKDVNEAAFTALNTDEETVITIPSDKVQVVSAQPVASYQLLPVGEDQMELRILDPTEFRKIKHLVIVMA